MTLLAQLFGLPGLTIAATAESFLALRVFPNHYISQHHLLTVVVIFLANYAFGILLWTFIYPRLVSPLRHIPGPRSLISVVHKALLITDRPSGDLFLDLIKKYPGQELISIGISGRSILVTKPRLLSELLVHRAYDFIKPPIISRFLRPILGDGLIIVEGDTHKFLRKNSMPAFSFRHIKDLYPMMWKISNRFTSVLKRDVVENQSSEKPEGKVVELSKWTSRATLDIIGDAGLGHHFNMLEKSEDPLLKIYEALTEPTGEKLAFASASMALGLSFVRLLPWRMNDVFNHLSSSLNEICFPLIAEKKKAIDEKRDDHFDILSLLIKSDNFSDVELKDQLLTFLAAGHETTASALTWACYLLSKHPVFQQRLREEVHEALPVDAEVDGSVDLAGILESLPYLNGIILETLRLYPTVPLTVRQAIHDTHLSEQFIPQGTVMVLSTWLMNRSPEVWGADAGEFRPERWITDGKPNQNGGASSNYEFLTFLHGPRSCIGQGFAKAEMRCLLAAMVGSFSWTLAMDEKRIVPRGVLTIKPANGMYLNLKPLDA